MMCGASRCLSYNLYENSLWCILRTGVNSKKGVTRKRRQRKDEGEGRREKVRTLIN